MSGLIPIQVLYAGLAGTFIALLVATAQNQWQPRVFFLLALRLAIGWHFLFEGMHKIHSHLIGPTDWNRPFTSEPYFAVAEGPFGEYMRATYIGDPGAVISANLTPVKEITPSDFEALSLDEQAKLCPPTPASELARGIPDAAKAKSAQAEFARWVYGVDRREGPVSFVSTGNVMQTAPDRLRHIALMQKFVQEIESRQALGLGNGHGYDLKRAAAARADLRTSQATLANDINGFISTLITGNGGTIPDPEPKPIAKADRQTKWLITGVGISLLLGLFTRIGCVVGAGFLLLTYLTHPPFPWYPLPPNTEGNPLFINKNVIEMLAMLAIAAHPTGKWLGLDSIISWVLFDRKRAA